MSLPLIDYETIEYNDKFKEFLGNEYPILFSQLENSKFKLSEVPPKRLRQILILYKLFIEAKKSCFNTASVGKEQTSPISYHQLKSFLTKRTDGVSFQINFQIGPIKKSLNYKYSVEDYTKEKIIDICLSELTNLALKFPDIMNIIYWNHDLKISVVPYNDKIINKGLRGVSKDHTRVGAFINPFTKVQGRIIENIYCFEIFVNEYPQMFEMMLRHEFYHLIDVAASNPDGFNYYRKVRTYSEILNERLNGKLKSLGERQIKYCEKALKEIISLDLQRKDLIEKEREILIKNNCWTVVRQHTDKAVGTSALSREPKGDLIKEVFAYALEVYFKDKYLIKQTDPEMFDIIEKYILPELGYKNGNKSKLTEDYLKKE